MSTPRTPVPAQPQLVPLPAGLVLVLDPGVRRIEEGTVLVGGAPLRVLRLTPAGARLVDRIEAGEPVPPGAAATRLARRLLDGGLAHPRPDLVAAPYGPADAAVVIPVRDRPAGLARTLACVAAGAATGGTPGEIVVVDDGSVDPAEVAGVVARATAADADVADVVDRAALLGVRIVRHDVPQGPAAARNTGWRETSAPVVAFLDADVEPDDGWLTALLAHLADTAVVAVAPRIVPLVPEGVPGWLGSYEAMRSPLDLGPSEAPVRPGSRVSYVPTAALVMRRDALDQAGGFDETMTHGEDVDLVWRLAAAGGTVRYEPRATVAHPVRPDLSAWLRQRYGYGSSAAPLAVRHPGAVAPLTVSGWSAAAWGLVALGAPVAGVALGAATTAALVPRLRNLAHPWREAARLAGLGNLYAGRQVADALRRAWVPLLVPMALRSRSRPALVATLVVPAALEWAQRRPRLGPARWTAFRLADDLAYAAGVWGGSLAEGTTAALRPSFAGRFPPPAPADPPSPPDPAEAMGSAGGGSRS